MMLSKKRANKRQRELLVERVLNNMEMARGNQADTVVVEMWAGVAKELNSLGCSRTAREWQHIWRLWVAKIKTKANKLRQSQSATGDGSWQAEADLTALEKKIMFIVGSPFAVDGHSNHELGIPSILDQQWLETDELDVGSKGDHNNQSTPEEPPRQQSTQPTHFPRRRTRARPRPPVHNNLVQALNDNTERLCAAIVRAAEILAAAITRENE